MDDHIGNVNTGAMMVRILIITTVHLEEHLASPPALGTNE